MMLALDRGLQAELSEVRLAPRVTHIVAGARLLRERHFWHSPFADRDTLQCTNIGQVCSAEVRDTHTYVCARAHTRTRPDQIIRHEERAGVLRPAYVLIRDEQVGALVLCIRGTQEMKDLFTSLTGAFAVDL
eukprot:237911-Pelagomonas_calceolata.AAC.6